MVNKKLTDFRNEEIANIKNAFTRVRNYNRLHGSPFNMSTNNEYTHIIISSALINFMSRDTFSRLTTPGSPRILSVHKIFWGISKSVDMFHVTVNKGTTLRLVNHMLDRSHVFGSSPAPPSYSPILEVIFGDAMADVPMVRKDLEIRGFGRPVVAETMASTEQRFADIFPGIRATSKDQWWFFSGVPSKSAIHENDPLLKTSLNHLKIQEYGNMGLLGIMTAIEKQLNQLPDLPQ